VKKESSKDNWASYRSSLTVSGPQQKHWAAGRAKESLKSNGGAPNGTMFKGFFRAGRCAELRTSSHEGLWRGNFSIFNRSPNRFSQRISTTQCRRGGTRNSNSRGEFKPAKPTQESETTMKPYLVIFSTDAEQIETLKPQSTQLPYVCYALGNGPTVTKAENLDVLKVTQMEAVERFGFNPPHPVLESRVLKTPELCLNEVTKICDFRGRSPQRLPSQPASRAGASYIRDAYRHQGVQRQGRGPNPAGWNASREPQLG
jgi:hypothetical protein